MNPLELAAAAEAMGVRFYLGERGDHWYFGSFNRAGLDDRGVAYYEVGHTKGRGAMWLAYLCALADDEGRTMRLWCKPEMLAYYQRFRFRIETTSRWGGKPSQYTLKRLPKKSRRRALARAA